jgi:hypothetical protein
MIERPSLTGRRAAGRGSRYPDFSAADQMNLNRELLVSMNRGRELLGQKDRDQELPVSNRLGQGLLVPSLRGRHLWGPMNRSNRRHPAGCQ